MTTPRAAQAGRTVHPAWAPLALPNHKGFLENPNYVGVVSVQLGLLAWLYRPWTPGGGVSLEVRRRSRHANPYLAVPDDTALWARAARIVTRTTNGPDRYLRVGDRSDLIAGPPTAFLEDAWADYWEAILTVDALQRDGRVRVVRP